MYETSYNCTVFIKIGRKINLHSILHLNRQKLQMLDFFSIFSVLHCWYIFWTGNVHDPNFRKTEFCQKFDLSFDKKLPSFGKKLSFFRTEFCLKWTKKKPGLILRVKTRCFAKKARQFTE